jgi:HD-like signal output (HDOD) protein
MRIWQLAWVLAGIVVALIAIAALARAALRPGRRRALQPAEAAALPSPGLTGARGTGAAPSAENALIARAAAPPARGAGSEPPAQREARLQIVQRLQTLAFGLAPNPAPDSAAAARASAAERADAAANARRVSAAETVDSQAHEQITAEIRRTLLNVADRPNYAPRRPLLLPKLMQAMNDDEVSRRELSRIIGTDPALAGSLLRLANSPFYRLQPDPVESLDRAIALLGLEGMRSLIAAALLQPVFRISGGMFVQFGEVTWEHTLYSAGAAEAHAAVAENTDPFAAQLLALIMGLAAIVVFRVATDAFLAHHLRPDARALAAFIDLETAPVARRVAASWELSERIDTALAEQSAGTAGPATPLGRSLQIGRYLGALALLHQRAGMSEEEVLATLQSAGPRAEAYARIWSRLMRSNT